jgi:hypothetical protein
MQKIGHNSPLLLPIECKLLPSGLFFFILRLLSMPLGIFVVCADSLVYFHVNRTVLEPLVL